MNRVMNHKGDINHEGNVNVKDIIKKKPILTFTNITKRIVKQVLKDKAASDLSRFFSAPKRMRKIVTSFIQIVLTYMGWCISHPGCLNLFNHLLQEEESIKVQGWSL